MNTPTYHNPDNLPSPGEGWRFLVEGEERQPGDEWCVSGQHWRSVWKDGTTQPGITYRTRRPLPVAVAQTEAGSGLVNRCYTLREELRDTACPALVIYAFIKAEIEKHSQELATVRRELEEAKGVGLSKIFAADEEISSLRRQLEEAQRERDEARRYFAVSCRALGNWRVFPSSATQNQTEKDWKVATKAIIERDELQIAHSALLTHAEALARALEEDAARAAYNAGLGASEWEAFLSPTARAILAAYRAHQKETL